LYLVKFFIGPFRFQAGDHRRQSPTTATSSPVHLTESGCLRIWVHCSRPLRHGNRPYFHDFCYFPWPVRDLFKFCRWFQVFPVSGHQSQRYLLTDDDEVLNITQARTHWAFYTLLSLLTPLLFHSRSLKPHHRLASSLRTASTDYFPDRFFW